ncbi:MAG: hypothetical protein WBM69_08125 [Desulfobacterales bacterium]
MSKKDVSTRPTIETITPLTAPPIKRKGADTENLNRQHRIKILALLGSLVLLVISGGSLLYYLSKNPLQTGKVSNIPSPAPVEVKKKLAESTKEQAMPKVDPEQLAREKETAEQKLADFLEARNNLDGKGVADWGEPSYIEMIKFGEAADSAFMNKEYKAAAEQYGRATSIANDLADRSGQALIRLLDEGQTALDAGDGPLAQRKFATALRIDSANQVARRGLERAKTIEAVTALIASGRQHEAGGDLSLAAADYQKALQLDAYSQEARTALESVNGRIKEAQFQQLISGGLAAFHNNDYQVARNRLIKAKALKPNSLEVRDALSQVDQAIRLARIDTLSKQALAAEQTEDWQSALSSYQAVLEIDKNVQFAGRGKNRAAEQIRIAKRFDFFLAQPETLESDSQLNNAIVLLSEAGDVKPQGPKLAERIKKLESLVRIARTPIKITIQSDNLTHVAVYRVGKLGRFEVRELELRPGTYTVVGARDGYQDVRQKIVVEPGRQPLRVTVKCRVKI